MSEFTDANVDNLVYDQRISSIVINKNLQNILSPSVGLTIKSFSSDKQTSKNALYLYNPNSNEVQQMTRSQSIFSPIFSIDSFPGATIDSTLYLKDNQVWQLPIHGGESSQVTNFCLPIEHFKIFSGLENQQYLAVVLNVFSNLTPQETVAKLSEIQSSGSSGILFDSLMVRHWDKWNPYTQRNHIFICPLDIKSDGLYETNESKLIDIMYGMDTDCPGKSLQGDEQFDISSDGHFIAFSARDNLLGNKSAWTTSASIYLVTLPPFFSSDTSNNLETRIISNGNAMNLIPKFSSDNTKLRFLSMERPVYEADKLQIKIYDINTNQLKSITNEIDLSFECMEWSENNQTMYSTAQYHGITKIFRLTIEYDSTNHEPTLSLLEVFLNDNSCASPAFVINPNATNVNKSKTLYYLESSLIKPKELKLLYLNEKSNKELFQTFVFQSLIEGIHTLKTELNSSNIVEIYNPTPQYNNGDLNVSIPLQHVFIGGNNDLIHSWYLPPSNHDGVSKVPLLLIVHGGPQGAMLNTWSYRWNLGIFANQGYGVLAINFHGSTGYGQQFTDSIRNDWGGKPFDDCMLGVDSILKHYQYLDNNNVAALGASYGGYMMNWINGHTNRFKCLVNHAGIFSTKNLFYTTEELWFPGK